MRLQRVTIAEGTQLTLYFLRWNGVCPAEEETDRVAADPARAAEVIALFVHIANNGFRTPSKWFRKLHEREDIWEIRKWGRFRVYGFMVNDREFYLCEWERKRGSDPNRRLLDRVARLRDAWLAAERMT